MALRVTNELGEIEFEVNERDSTLTINGQPLMFPTDTGTSGMVLATDGDGGLSWVNSGGSSSYPGVTSDGSDGLTVVGDVSSDELFAAGINIGDGNFTVAGASAHFNQGLYVAANTFEVTAAGNVTAATFQNATGSFQVDTHGSVVGASGMFGYYNNPSFSFSVDNDGNLTAAGTINLGNNSLTIDGDSNAVFAGDVTAATFTGDGSGLTGVNATVTETSPTDLTGILFGDGDTVNGTNKATLDTDGLVSLTNNNTGNVLQLGGTSADAIHYMDQYGNPYWAVRNDAVTTIGGYQAQGYNQLVLGSTSNPTHVIQFTNTDSGYTLFTVDCDGQTTINRDANAVYIGATSGSPLHIGNSDPASANFTVGTNGVARFAQSGTPYSVVIGASGGDGGNYPIAVGSNTSNPTFKVDLSGIVTIGEGDFAQPRQLVLGTTGNTPPITYSDTEVPETYFKVERDGSTYVGKALSNSYTVLGSSGTYSGFPGVTLPIAVGGATSAVPLFRVMQNGDAHAADVYGSSGYFENITLQGSDGSVAAQSFKLNNNNFNVDGSGNVMGASGMFTGFVRGVQVRNSDDSFFANEYGDVTGRSFATNSNYFSVDSGGGVSSNFVNNYYSILAGYGNGHHAVIGGSAGYPIHLGAEDNIGPFKVSDAGDVWGATGYFSSQVIATDMIKAGNGHSYSAYIGGNSGFPIGLGTQASPGPFNVSDDGDVNANNVFVPGASVEIADGGTLTAGAGFFTANQDALTCSTDVVLADLANTTPFIFPYVYTDGSGLLLLSGLENNNNIVNLTAQSAAVSSVLTVPSRSDGNPHTYEIGGYLTITAISVNSITLQVTYTDETNTARTVSMFPQGLTSAAVATTGVFTYPNFLIRTYPGNANIIVKTVVVGIGSQTYDVGGMITLLK